MVWHGVGVGDDHVSGPRAVRGDHVTHGRLHVGGVQVEELKVGAPQLADTWREHRDNGERMSKVVKMSGMQTGPLDF